MIRPCSRWWRAAATDVRLGDAVHADGGHQASIAAQRFQGVLQARPFITVPACPCMGRRLVDTRVAGGELRAAEDVPAADDQRQLHAALRGVVGLLGQVEHRIDGDAALAGVDEAFTGDLQHHPPIRRVPTG